MDQCGIVAIVVNERYVSYRLSINGMNAVATNLSYCHADRI